MSLGEDKIAKLLSENNMLYKKEVTFPNLHGKKDNLLRFDFGVYDRSQNYKLIALIEYDGELHFSQIAHFNSGAQFKEAQGRDRKKNTYCLANGILLIRVPFWDLEKITFLSLFANPEYKVTSIWHNDLLKAKLEKQKK